MFVNPLFSGVGRIRTFGTLFASSTLAGCPHKPLVHNSRFRAICRIRTCDGDFSTAVLQTATFDRSVTRQLNFSCRYSFRTNTKCFRGTCATITPTGNILRVGVEPTRPCGHQILSLVRLPFPPPKVISSERDLNPHVLADTRLSTLRVYQFHHLTLSAWRDSNPHAGTPATDLKSVVSTNSTTSRYFRSPGGTRTPTPFGT